MVFSCGIDNLRPIAEVLLTWDFFLSLVHNSTEKAALLHYMMSERRNEMILCSENSHVEGGGRKPEWACVEFTQGGRKNHIYKVNQPRIWEMKIS